MRKVVGRLLVGAVAVGALVIIAWGLFSPVKSHGTVSPSTVSHLVGLQVGNIAPNFSLVTAGGKQIHLSDFRGQPVVLMFSSTGCRDCQLQVTDAQKVYARELAAHKVFVLLGIDTQDTASTIMQIDPQSGIALPRVLTQTSPVSELYQVRGTPASIFIDRKGIIHAVVEGELDEAAMQRQVEEIIT
jgi:peroxiredoxin